MNFPRLSHAGLVVVFALSACHDASELLTPPSRQESSVAPICFGRPATIYPGNPSNPAGAIVDDGDGTYTITGTAGPDIIVGTESEDLIDGLAGKDRICSVGGNDVLVGGAGEDSHYGGDGIDVVTYAASAAGVTVRLAGAGAGIGGDAEGDQFLAVENITGSAFADELRGDAGANVLTGLGGDDDIWGRGGADELLGGSGNDILHGEDGADVLNGGADDDELVPGAGDDALDGDTGEDLVSYATSPSGVTVDLAGGPGAGGDAANDTYANIDNVTGSNFGDTLDGNGDPNYLSGLDGDDTLNGAGNADKLWGGNGADVIHGNTGNDILHGRQGDDDLYGDEGLDKIYGEEGVDQVFGGDGDDDLRPGPGANVVDGGPDTDTLLSGSCIDSYTNIEIFTNTRCTLRVDATQSTITPAAATIFADNGTSTTTITVQLKNFAGASLTSGGSTVVLTTDAGELNDGSTSATTLTALDQNNGTYTLALHSSGNLETATITGTVDGNPITDDASVEFTVGPLDHFLVEGAGGGDIADQASGVAFNILITAQDVANHTVTGFTGTVDLISTPGGSLGTSGAFTAGVRTQSVTITGGNNYTITATKSGDTETGTSNSFVVTAGPSAVADANGGTSAPGDAYHTAYNTALNIPDGAQDLLNNDGLGFPAATLTHVGAIRCNNGSGTLNVAVDAVTQHAAGANISLAGYTGCGAGSLQVNADGSLTWTPSATYTGQIQFTYRIANGGGTSDATATLAVGIRPTAGNSTYGSNLLGNVPINTANSSNTVVTATGDNPAFGYTASVGGTGLIDAATRKYQFTPNAGFTGSASFTFNVTNGFGTSPTTGTVTLPVANLLWFVNAGAGAGGNGTQGSPFNCLVGASCYNGSANVVNNLIYATTGTYNDNAALVLKDGQKLIGQGTVAADFATAAGITWPADAGAQPSINGTAPTITTSVGNNVTLASGNTLRGIALGNGVASSAALAGTNFGTLTFATDVSISTNTQALSLNNGTLSGNFGTVTSTGGTNNIALTTVSSGAAITLGGPFSGATGTNIVVAGGNVPVNFTGNVTQGNNAALLSVSAGHTGTLTFSTGTVNATNGSGLQFDNADGTYNFNGTTTLSGTTAGIDILNGSAGTFVFGTGTEITHSGASDQAFFHSGSDADVTFSGTITKTGGSWATDIFNQGAASTITFQTESIIANGASTGLTFNNADGVVNYNGTTTLSGGTARINVQGSSSGSLNFGTNASSSGAPLNVGALHIVNDGAATNIDYNGSLANTVGRPLHVQGVGSGTVNIDGSMTSTGQGVLLQGNGGGTINFTHATKTLSTTTNAAFTSTGTGATVAITNGLAITTTSGAGLAVSGGGTITITNGSGVNTVSSGTGTAVSISGTTIGSSGVHFKSVSANGAPNGIVLANTGTSGGIFVEGDGTANSGGMIQATTSHGISLNNTVSPNFTRMQITNTSGHGIFGMLVDNFSLTNSTISISGTTEIAGRQESNISFYQNAGTGTEKNITGAVTITGNTFNTALHHGINITQYDGTISSLNISNNTFTSATASSGSSSGATTSHGTAINVNLIGSGGTIANLTSSTINNNNITGFPGNAGVLFSVGNANTGGPTGSYGAVNDSITISSNRIRGHSSANLMNTQAINVAINGKGTGYFRVIDNGTVAEPLGNNAGHTINLSSFGFAALHVRVQNNRIVSNNTVGSNAISMGVDSAAGFGPVTTAVMNAKVIGNTMSATNGSGVLILASRSGTMRARVNNNSIGAPATSTYGMQLRNAASTTNTGTACYEISGNTVGTGPGATFPGTGLRRQSGVVTNGPNVFGIVGLPGGSTASPGVENYVGGMNTSAAGSFGSMGVGLASATSGFASCTLPF